VPDGFILDRIIFLVAINIVLAARKSKSSCMARYKLTYFNAKAIAEPIRFLFHYVGVEFEDNRLDRSNWESLKEQYPWGVLPLLEHEDKKLSQSFTIGRYLGKQFKLTGTDEFESAKCDEYGDVLKDLLLECRGFFVEVNESKRREIRNHIVNVQVPKYFGRLDQDLAENGGKHLVGNCYTWIDFFAAHYVDFLSTAVESNLLEKYPHLEAFKNSVLSIPQIKAWIEQRPQTPM